MTQIEPSDEEVNSDELQRVLGYNLVTQSVDIEDTISQKRSIQCDPVTAKGRNKHDDALSFEGNSFVQGWYFGCSNHRLL